MALSWTRAGAGWRAAQHTPLCREPTTANEGRRWHAPQRGTEGPCSAPSQEPGFGSLWSCGVVSWDLVCCFAVGCCWWWWSKGTACVIWRRLPLKTNGYRWPARSQGAGKPRDKDRTTRQSPGCPAVGFSLLPGLQHTPGGAMVISLLTSFVPRCLHAGGGWVVVWPSTARSDEWPAWYDHEPHQSAYPPPRAP